MRQAHQSRMNIMRRCRRGAPDHRFHVRQRGEEPCQRVVALHDHMGAAPRQQRRVARELDAVAEPLLIVQEDAPTLEIAALPQRRRQAARLHLPIGQPGAPFIVAEPRREIAPHQQAGCQEGVGSSLVGPLRDDLAARGLRLVQPVQAAQDQRAVHPRLGVVRLQHQGVRQSACRCLVSSDPHRQSEAQIVQQARIGRASAPAPDGRPPAPARGDRDSSARPRGCRRRDAPPARGESALSGPLRPPRTGGAGAGCG